MKTNKYRDAIKYLAGLQQFKMFQAISIAILNVR